MDIATHLLKIVSLCNLFSFSRVVADNFRHYLIILATPLLIPVVSNTTDATLALNTLIIKS